LEILGQAQQCGGVKAVTICQMEGQSAIIIIIITLLSLKIYKHVCDKYKQTNNCVYEKKRKKKRKRKDKHNELFMSQ
jgi:hypothetical protein